MKIHKRFNLHEELKILDISTRLLDDDPFKKFLLSQAGKKNPSSLDIDALTQIK